MPALLLYLVLLLPIGLLLIHVYVQNRRQGRFVNRIPGPPGLPIIGNALDVNLETYEFYKLLRNWMKIYYPIFKIWLFNVSLIHIRHPDDIEAVLSSSKHINKDFGYDYIHIWLKSGLLTSSGEKWHHRRKILTPAFHFNILKKYMEITNEQGEKATIRLKKKGPETSVDLVTFCLEYTLNIICESAMGVAVDGESGKEPKTRYKAALHEITQLIIYRMLRPYITKWTLPLMPSLHKQTTNCLTVLDNFTSEIIKQRRQYHKETNYMNLEQLQNETQDDDVCYGKRKRLAMLDLLLSAEKDGLIDNEGIKEEVSTFIFEGHDTTAMSLCFTIMLLAENEDVQKRARIEVENIMNQKGGKLEIADLSKMVYLEMVIKESLRLYPSVPTIVRYMSEDLQLKHCFAPKGANVVLHIVDVQRDPNFWPNPDHFDPDRFLPEEMNKRHPYCYVPFSAGSRNCIGQKFARMELKSLIARILYNFYLEPIDRLETIEAIGDLILRPSRPVQTKFTRINRD